MAPAVQSMTATEAVTFDFGADDQTNALLLQDAQTFITGNMARIMAAKHAHDLTANHYQGSWGKWCAAVGISRDTGDRMVSVAAQCGNIQLEGKSILDVQPLKLLYAAAKPSTPEVVKQAVFTGDITTYKEYQELMAQLKAEKDRADKAEARAKNAEDALKKQPIVGVTDPEEVRRMPLPPKQRRRPADRSRTLSAGLVKPKPDTRSCSRMQTVSLRRSSPVPSRQRSSPIPCAACIWAGSALPAPPAPRWPAWPRRSIRCAMKFVNHWKKIPPSTLLRRAVWRTQNGRRCLNEI
mgnify:CR=1 FL=1